MGGLEDDRQGIFHTHLVVRDIDKSVRFYNGLFGMEQVDFKDGTLVILSTPDRGDLLVLNPGGEWRYPGGCAKEQPREEGLAGIQGGIAHFGYMLPNKEEYERVIASAGELGGRVVVRCDHGTSGLWGHTYLADPDGYVCEIQFGR